MVDFKPLLLPDSGAAAHPWRVISRQKCNRMWVNELSRYSVTPREHVGSRSFQIRTTSSHCTLNEIKYKCLKITSITFTYMQFYSEPASSSFFFFLPIGSQFAAREENIDVMCISLVTGWHPQRPSSSWHCPGADQRGGVFFQSDPLQHLQSRVSQREVSPGSQENTHRWVLRKPLGWSSNSKSVHHMTLGTFLHNLEAT